MGATNSSERNNVLPDPDLFARIGRFVDIGSSDLTSLCIVGGKQAADRIRIQYLQKNDEYLRHTSSSGSAKLRKAKVLNWLEANGTDWKSRCNASSGMTNSSGTARVEVSDLSHLEKLKFKETKFGSVAFGDVVRRNDPPWNGMVNEGDPILSIGGTDVTNCSLEDVENMVASVRNALEVAAEDDAPIAVESLVFMTDTSYLFQNPTAAIWTGAVPLLKEMIKSGYVNEDGTYQHPFSPIGGRNSLLHYAVMLSPDISCLEYLLSLPGQKDSLRVSYRSRTWPNIIHSCACSATEFSPSAMKMLLELLPALDVNAPIT